LTGLAWECSRYSTRFQAAHTTSSSRSRHSKASWYKYGAVGHRLSTSRGLINYDLSRPQYTTACSKFPINSSLKALTQLQSTWRKEACEFVPYRWIQRLKYSRVVLDPRLGFTVFKGFAVTFVFGIRELLNRWGKMQLKHSPELERKVQEINSLSQKIGTNFTFQ